jgi:5-methylcytosine-specific restriction enzyme subunit McrC
MPKEIIELREWTESEQLVEVEIAKSLRNLNICTALLSSNGKAQLSSFRRVGVVSIGDTVIRIQPKVPIRNLLFMLDENVSSLSMIEDEVYLQESSDWTNFLVHYFLRQLQQALIRGPLEGYEEIKEFSPRLRGRIEFSKLAYLWHSGNLQLPINYDDLSVNILENQILRTAIEVLLSTISMSLASRTKLENFSVLLSSCSLISVGQAVPQYSITARNSHYASVLKTAELIITSHTVSHNDGEKPTKSFLIDVASLFEKYIEREFRKLSGSTPISFSPQPASQHLDDKKLIGVRPDYLWFQDNIPIGVADAKYKIVRDYEVPSSDVYQCLSYAVRYGLFHAHLIYAEAESFETLVLGADVTLHVHGIDLNSAIPEIEARVKAIFQEIIQPSMQMN